MITILPLPALMNTRAVELCDGRYRSIDFLPCCQFPLDIQYLRLLSSMSVLCACVNFQLTEHGTAQRTFGSMPLTAASITISGLR